MNAPLVILPGSLIVTFLVRLAGAGSAFALPPGRFLEGLKLACDLLGFHELHREDEALEDLLPWAGNV